ncbi:NAD(P)/FAD-dependent oxidoreductase [Sporosarcina siberiensis]|uniref:NAD(P)/FAD-dependent oxidoreductase n=1 Tax=Sporosarcina siberiensis TaxID=1365606 RepID=A0ABW4SLB0_9BACL
MKIIVLGAGIVGSSAAYYLARKGIDITLIDSSHDGKATAAGAGIVCPWITNVTDEDWYVLAKEGAIDYANLIQQLKDDGEYDVGYGLVGALAVSEDSGELDEIERIVNLKRMETDAVGKVSRLSPVEAKRLFPPLKDSLSAVHVSGAARVDGRLLIDALKRASIKHGASFVSGEAELLKVDEQIIGVHINGETIISDKIIVAGGAWTPKLFAEFGIEIKVEPQKGQIAHLKMPGINTSEWPVVLPQSSHYLVSFEHSKVVVGATRETGSGFDYRLTVSGVKEVLDEALEVAPGLAMATLEEVRIGFRPAGQDILPLLGSLDDFPNIVVATGLGASGLTIGPIVGKLAAGLALDDEIPIDLSPYNPLRHAIKV